MFKNLSVKLAVLALLPTSAGKYTTIYKKTGSWSPRPDHNTLSPMPNLSPGHSPPLCIHTSLTHAAHTHALIQNQICNAFLCPRIMYTIEGRSCYC